jgi:malate dehydrogenase (oxaloacetate-decarboxylating)
MQTPPFQHSARIRTEPTTTVETADDLAAVYTPGVADAVQAIADDPREAAHLSTRGNAVAVIGDGSAVLGLGDVGPLAGLPVFEGKAALLRRFAGMDAWPLCLRSRDIDDMARTIRDISTGFAAINIEDVAAPRCFTLERILQSELDIPVFHDDQHGTAIVVAAGLANALRVVDKRLDGSRVVIAGAGAAGSAVARLLSHAGVADLVVCDSNGILHSGRDDLSSQKRWLVEHTNSRAVRGSLSDALVDADVFVGVSSPNLVGEQEIASMASDAIVFALANPDPEVDPALAKQHAAVVATGRSDFPNQINNAVAFPGVLRGLIDSSARDLTLDIECAAAQAIAATVPDTRLAPDFIVPSVFDEHLVPAVAAAVGDTATSSG